MSNEGPFVLLSFPSAVGEMRGRGAGSADEFTADLALRRTVQPLRERGLPLGLLAFGSSWTRESLSDHLDAAGVADLFDEELLLVSKEQDAGNVAAALAAASIDPGRCVFVSISCIERGAAATAGVGVSPHVALVPSVLDGVELCYVQFTATDAADISAILSKPDLPLVPMSVRGGDQPALLALSTRALVTGTAFPGTTARVVGDSALVARTDLTMFHPGAMNEVEAADLRARLGVEGVDVLDDHDDEWTLASPFGHVVDVEPTRKTHGHTLALIPSRHPMSIATSAIAPLSPLDATVQQALGAIDAALIEAYATPWYRNDILSRSTLHEHNQIAVDRMAIALGNILGSGYVTTPQLRASKLRNVVGTLPGSALPNEIVIIGAHLDSIANLPCDHAAGGNIAPGADDDASGVAAVLACAHAFFQAGLKPRRTIEFVLFNSEELGKLGSVSYARTVSKRVTEQAAVMRAMFQMDMIGYRRPGEAPIFEIHGIRAGDFPDGGQELVDRTSDIVLAVDAARSAVAPNLQAQIHPTADCPTNFGMNRSDHKPFLSLGLPACLITQNFFSDLVCGQEACNPDYHSACDDHIDFPYAADIARAVAGAVWMIANA